MVAKSVLLVLLLAVTILVAGCAAPSPSGYAVSEKTTEPPLKEFAMDSFYEIVDGTPKPQFSLSEIVVDRGDRVRITVTNTKGNHDFVIDEYNIYADTPLNEPVTVEFVANEAGEFVYYCANPGHRDAGQWGTLRVLA